MRFINKAAAFAVALVSSSAIAGAQTTVSGSTTGCFGANCTNYTSTANYSITGTGEAISFVGKSFSGTTNPFTNGFSVGDFGALTLTPAPTGRTPNTMFTTPFSLMFNLTAPTGATSPNETFIVSGFVGNTNGQGTRDISYSGGMASFTFDGGSGEIMTDRGQIGVATTAISGRVLATTTPEPSSYAMMGMGLVGMAAAARRRRSA